MSAQAAIETIRQELCRAARDKNYHNKKADAALNLLAARNERLEQAIRLNTSWIDTCRRTGVFQTVATEVVAHAQRRLNDAALEDGP